MENVERPKPLPYDPDWVPTDLETWLPLAVLGNIFFPIMRKVYASGFYALADMGKDMSLVGKILGYTPVALILLVFLLWFTFHLWVALDNAGKGLFGKIRRVWRKLFLLLASSLPMLPHIFVIVYTCWCL